VGKKGSSIVSSNTSISNGEYAPKRKRLIEGLQIFAPILHAVIFHTTTTITADDIDAITSHLHRILLHRRGRSYTKLYGIRTFDKAGHPVEDGRAIVCFFLVVPCVVFNHITGQIADSFILGKE